VPVLVSRVNAINLGWTVTASEDALQQKASGSGCDWVAEAEKTFPLGRLIRPGDVACTVGFLLSTASAMVTGTAIDMHPEMIVGCVPRQFGNT
jgi:NAD(P)-dependent dehydrogenase (short-subunit alcohol dehydrogenase family)